MKISQARTAAFDVLLRIETDNAFSSILLPKYEEKLPEKDKGLCHELVLGVLRRQIYLDRLIDQFAAKPKFDPEVRIALRMGAFQLLFLERIPAYSSINESVNLVQRAKKSSAKGIVNAILRRIQREPVEFAFTDEIERISVKTSHPRWLIEKWFGQIGAAQTEQLAQANNVVGSSAFRLTEKSKKTGMVPSPEWRKSEFVEACYFADRIDSHLLRLAEAGDIYFQDEASQMVAATLTLPAGSRFLDVCASPGGKTTLIGMRNPDLRSLTAGDLHWRRVTLLKANCERQEAPVSVVQYDAEDGLPFADESFDAVLIDAPCSGTGTIRHNPEIRYSLKLEDFDDLARKQLRILESASKLVKLGGRIYYSTCSMEIEENEQVISQFLGDNSQFSKVCAPLDDRFRTSERFARTFPNRDNMDGFFLAVLERS